MKRVRPVYLKREDQGCGGDVEALDMVTFLDDFGRGFYDRPCPACVEGEWCEYP